MGSGHEREIGEIIATLRSIEDKLDGIDERYGRRVDDHESRLRHLETRASRLTGGLAVMNVLWAVVCVALSKINLHL